MKKKLSKLLLAMATVVFASALAAPAVAFADVVKVDAYDKLLMAIGEGSEVEIQLSGDITTSEMITIPAGKTVSIDLAGHDLIGAETEPGVHIYPLNNCGTLTIMDSSEAKTGSITGRGIYNGYDGEDTSNTVDGAKLTVESGTFYAQDTNGGAAIFNCAELVINGGTFDGQVAAVNNRAKGVMTINDGTFRSVGGYAIQNNGGATTINDATVDRGFGAVGAWGGTTVINDGTFLPTGAAEKTCHVVYVDNSSTTVTINGGTFKMNYPADAVPESGSAVASYYSGDVSITGGSFTSHFDNVSPVELSTGAEITGGTYLNHAGAASDHSYVISYVKEGHELNADGTVAEKYLPVKVNGTGYETLAKAIEAVGEGDVVIELFADATLDITAWQTLAIGGDTTETITINGNNNTLTFNKKNSDWNHVATNNGAKLILNDMTIIDSGHNDGPWNRYDLNFACDVELNNVTATKAMAFKADATLNDVTINETGDNYAIWIQANGQTVAIDGLTVNSAGRGVKIDDQYVDNAAKVTLSVENAEFTTAKKAAIIVKSPAGAGITLNDVDISNVAADKVNAVWVDEGGAADFGKVAVTGGAVAQENVEAFPIAVLDSNGNVVSYYKTLDELFAVDTSGEVTVELLGDISTDNQVDTAYDTTYNFITNVEDGVTMSWNYMDNWNYVQFMSLGEGVTLNVPGYLCVWSELEISGNVNTGYAYFLGADVTVNEGAVMNVTTGEKTTQVKNGATLTVNGTVNASTLNVWGGESKLIVSGENAEVNASWIDIWDGTPSVVIENGATLSTDAIKASRGGSVTVDGATLDTDNLELGHNGESVGTLDVSNGGKVTGEIKLTDIGSTVEGPAGMNVTSGVDGYEVVYVDGAYALAEEEAAAQCAAYLNGIGYESAAIALAAADDDGDVLEVCEDLTITGTNAAINISAAEGVKLVIIGGTFSSDPSSYVASGYRVSYDESREIWTVWYPYVPVDPGCPADAACRAFPDVDEDAWYHEVIDWAYAKGLLRGYDDTGLMGPNEKITRAQLLAILHRVEGEPAAAEPCTFTDVAEGAWHAGVIAWAQDEGLILGDAGKTTVRPDDVITREEIVTILWRYAQLADLDVSAGTSVLPFEDASEVSGWAAPAMQWAVGAGVILGDDATGLLEPGDDATRAEAMAMIERMGVVE